MSDKLKTRVVLTVECEVEEDPEFFAESELNPPPCVKEDVLRNAARQVLHSAMLAYSASTKGWVPTFKCLAGTVVMQVPRFEGDYSDE